jgi:CubicO group peptidase (beta-lactamase class C family)
MLHARAILQTATCLFLSFAVSPVFSQIDKVDEFVKTEMLKRKIPGLSIAIVKNDEIVKAKGYGLANVEWNAPATPETVYQSGSVGKQFTATLVMMLVEEGKMGLEDPIIKYIPDAPDIWKGITIRHLLTHTSGISSKFDEQINLHQDYTENELTKIIAGNSLDFQPGEKMSYSNAGYVMLGIIIHKATNRFYGDLLEEKIFKPLGMSTTRIINELDIVPNRAAGYFLLSGQLKNQGWVSPSLNSTADGNLYLTVSDLAKWDAALYTEKLLKRSRLDEMWAPVKLANGRTEPYGFGWWLHNVKGHRVIEHSGAWQGFTAHISRYVDDKLTVIVLANLARAGASEIANGIAGLENPELTLDMHKEIAIDPKIFDAYVGNYELEPGIILNFSRKGNKLYGWFPNLPQMEIFPESETTFFVREPDAQFTFVKDATGKVDRLILRMRGDREAKRIK